MGKILGERLKFLRQKCNLYQTDIANELKITMQAVSSWERGIQEPSVDNILKLCDILKATPNYLLGYDNNAPNYIKKEDLIQIPMPQDKEE